MTGLGLDQWCTVSWVYVTRITRRVTSAFCRSNKVWVEVPASISHGWFLIIKTRTTGASLLPSSSHPSTGATMSTNGGGGLRKTSSLVISSATKSSAPGKRPGKVTAEIVPDSEEEREDEAS